MNGGHRNVERTVTRYVANLAPAEIRVIGRQRQLHEKARISSPRAEHLSGRVAASVAELRI